MAIKRNQIGLRQGVDPDAKISKRLVVLEDDVSGETTFRVITEASEEFTDYVDAKNAYMDNK